MTLNGIRNSRRNKKCPYCGGPGDSYLQRYQQNYNFCRRCDLIFKDTQKSYHDVVRTYRFNYYKKFLGEQRAGHRLKLFEHILDLIEAKQAGGHLLDVGTGLGHFLVSASQRGWTVKGIEPSREAADFARKQNSIPVFQGTLNEYSDHALFEAVTCINVLDHSAEPWTELEKIGRQLQPGGVVYIRFPNGFLHARLCRWAHKLGLEDKINQYLIFHEFSFTPKFIARLLSDLGFYNITIRNSPPSEGDPHKLFPTGKMAACLKSCNYQAGRVIQKLSGGTILLGASLEVLAFRRPLKNVQFRSSSRKAIILTTGIH